VAAHEPTPDAVHGVAPRRPSDTEDGGEPGIDEIREMLSAHGIHHVAVTTADVLREARAAIVERKAAGLHDGMQFTYRNPDRSTDPRRAVEGARSVIVAARPYLPDRDVDPPSGQRVPARVARYAWIDHYEPLRTALREVASRLRRCGHRAVVFADDNSIVDRAVAHRAGLGWYGKNANILLPGAGSFFVLGSIVTTAAYPPSERPIDDGCGSCTRCIEQCPTGAIVAPGVIDGGRCLSWVGQKVGPIDPALRPALADRIYGCDDCQEACPISVRLGPRNSVPVDETAQPWVDALDVLDGDEQSILARHGRWYIADRDVRWLRRNALVIAGNVGDPADDRLLGTLERYRTGADALLAEHAEWALARLRERRATMSPT
jgi:epoxyqueuosine reductase